MPLLTKEQSEASMPLLADTGRSVCEEEVKHVLQFWVRLTTFLGFLLGILAPLMAVAATLFLAYLSTQQGLCHSTSEFPFAIVWSTIVAIVVVYAHYLCYRILLSRIRSQGMAEVTMELLKLRFTLGTLSGILLTWAATCMMLGFGLWDKLGLIIEAVAVLLYFGSCTAYLRKEDFHMLAVDTDPTVSMQV